MYNSLIGILLVLSVCLVVIIFMQPTKNQSSNVFDSNDGALFERAKARGFEATMRRITAALAGLWLIVALLLVLLSSR